MKDVIIFKDFSKSYGNFTAVKNLNLSVEKGSITGFVGKNGAGKSTTIRSLMNIIFPTSGSVKVMNLDSAKNAKEVKKFVSYIPSDSEFYDNTTGADVFGLCCDINSVDRDKIDELCQYFELDKTKEISKLSLGNKKKVSIIQGLLKNSEIYVMDEPTNGLDPLMQEKFFQKILEEQKKGKTIFLSSHNLREIEKYCNRVIIIKDGEVVQDININEERTSCSQIVEYTLKNGEHKKFSFEGEINSLIGDLSLLDIEKLEIRQSSMEDEFIKFYN